LPAKSNILLGLVAGVSCLLIGFALSTLAYRYRYLRVPGWGLIERMNHELDLTPAQRGRIGDILRDTRFKVMQARQDFQHRRHELFWDGLGQVRAVLTPEQQKIFDRDFTQPWAHHRHGGGRGDDGDRMPLEEGAPPQAAPQPPPVPQN
jgi:Spy/CpxP family protein refolding chaperone